jgi:ADP-ribose pyrophosphatase
MCRLVTTRLIEAFLYLEDMSGNWSKLEEEIHKARYRSWVDRTYRLPDGTVRVFEIKLEEPIVTVLALTPEKLVILARQFRPGPEAVLLDMPGGVVDPGESPADAARRELREETGFEGNLIAVATNFDCAYSTRSRHTFAALDCLKVVDPDPGEGEFVDVEFMSVDDFRDHLRGGRLTDVESGYLALDTLGLL